MPIDEMFAHYTTVEALRRALAFFGDGWEVQVHPGLIDTQHKIALALLLHSTDGSGSYGTINMATANVSVFHDGPEYYEYYEAHWNDQRQRWERSVCLGDADCDDDANWVDQYLDNHGPWRTIEAEPK